MEAICGGFVDCAGAPRMGETLAWGPGSRSRSGTIAMIPTGDETDTAKEEPPFVKIKNKPAAVKESEILGVSSPDPQGLPTRTVTWAGQESFSWKESDEPSRFFPDDRDACSDSSSACAENEQDGNGGNESSESESVSTELDQSEIKINAADGFGEAIKYDERTTSEEIVAVVDGKSLALENSTDTLQQVQGAGSSSAIDDDTLNLHVLPAEGFVVVRELVGEPDTGAAAVVDKAPQWSIGYKMAVVVAALATFVLGMIVGVGVYGYRAAATFRVPSTAVTLHVHPTIESTAEPNGLVDKSTLGLDADTEARYRGRTAAASALAPVGTITSHTSPFGRHTPPKTTNTKAVDVNVDEIDAQTQAVRRMRNTREVIEEVQGAWIEITSTAAQGGGVPGLLDGPGPGAPNFVDDHGTPPTIALHASVGWFAKSLDRLTRDYRPGFEGLMNGPWA